MISQGTAAMNDTPSPANNGQSASLSLQPARRYLEYGTRRIHPELPIFGLTKAGQHYIYVPGHAYRVAPDTADILQAGWATGRPLSCEVARLRQTLTAQAQAAQQSWKALGEEPYRPVCLTVYLSNRCNLGCVYCFSAPARHSVSIDRRSRGVGNRPIHYRGCVREEGVEEPAKFVSSYCRSRGLPLTVVFHGGGEPTLHWRLLQDVVALTRRVAAAQGVGWWAYIATHGVLTTDKAEWLARHFDLIGLSCDGPPDIHDRQRPTAHGRKTAANVASTAEVLARVGTPFVVRATITPENIERQTEIAQDLHQRLSVKQIRFEPIYGPDDSGQTTFREDDAERFASAFLAAQRWANVANVDLSLSGVRPAEIHGPYCNVLRDVLQITPDGKWSACFLCTGGRDRRGDSLTISQDGKDDRSPLLLVDRIAAIRQRALSLPARCRDCFNLYHCARECPDHCPVLSDGDEQHAKRPFRCLLNQHLGMAWIEANAEPFPGVGERS